MEEGEPAGQNPLKMVPWTPPEVQTQQCSDPRPAAATRVPNAQGPSRAATRALGHSLVLASSLDGLVGLALEGSLWIIRRHRLRWIT